ncbi:dephospho-CoA kinase [Robertkochia aurantiaca]|uniref:dephospho-CoA kinase n=1 Tax=Robertkochia aurantiaca TaxID=2873700 RepID=UPI001CCAE20A|nr:dephospho-CoA kinase [Robertkochia sp. 3YJGBD-33]
MKTVGLTGGIGSGKSTVARMFEELGVPVYIADTAGKRLMAKSSDIRKKVIDLLGAEAYEGELPDRKHIASKVFEDRDLLRSLNAIIHPAVAKDFSRWKSEQDAPYVIKEAAILFETGGDKNCDYVITVTTPENIRIERVRKRDNVASEDVKARMQHQWDEDEKVKRADFVIENTEIDQTSLFVENIHEILLNKCK